MTVNKTFHSQKVGLAEALQQRKQIDNQSKNLFQQEQNTAPPVMRSSASPSCTWAAGWSPGGGTTLQALYWPLPLANRVLSKAAVTRLTWWVDTYVAVPMRTLVPFYDGHLFRSHWAVMGVARGKVMIAAKPNLLSALADIMLDSCLCTLGTTWRYLPTYFPKHCRHQFSNCLPSKSLDLP